jgi:hypothetical protein
MINPKLVDVFPDSHDGYPDDLAAGDTRDALMCAAGDTSRDFPESLWIEPKDWADAAADNDRHHTWPVDYLSHYTNQNPTHECTTHALRTGAEGARAFARNIPTGPPATGVFPPLAINADEVWLSCLSIYAEANPRKWGGASTRQVLEIAVKRGFLPDLKQPKAYGFKHSLVGTCGKGNLCQSSGEWVPLSQFPEGWKDTARHFRPVEVIFPETWEQMVCLVLWGRFVCVGRKGHSIPYGRWHPNEKVMEYPDSYDVTRFDSLSTMKNAVSGAYCIWSMTTPDDWTKPAG